jgi:phosphatidylserine/phosphatidylglycerophosphate/cardiolipin synthase-like enzyme
VDLTYAALKHDYKIMMLIDSKKKEKEVQEIAWELFEQWYDMTYIFDELLLKKLSIKYSKRKEKLKKQLLKFNVLK